MTTPESSSACLLSSAQLDKQTLKHKIIRFIDVFFPDSAEHWQYLNPRISLFLYPGKQFGSKQLK